MVHKLKQMLKILIKYLQNSSNAENISTDYWQVSETFRNYGRRRFENRLPSQKIFCTGENGLKTHTNIDFYFLIKSPTLVTPQSI